MKWGWNGRRLADPLTMVRRLLALPVLRVAQGLVFVATLLGWGWDDAMRTWREKE